MSGLTLPDTGHAADNIKQLFNRLLRITIHDRRYFIGRFTAIDREGNIVLYQAEEFRSAPQNEYEAEQKWIRETWYPKSQRSDMDGPGWGEYAKPYGLERQAREGEERKGGGEGEEYAEGVWNGREEGRMLASILIPKKEIVQVELIEERVEDMSLVL